MFCKNKRDGKQMASQKLLQLLHPNLKSWGSLVRMYGSRAITAQKSKKEKESEVIIFIEIILMKINSLTGHGGRVSKALSQIQLERMP